MCCVNIDPKDFIAWAEPILAKKRAIREQVQEEFAAAHAAWKALPWYKKLFTHEPGTSLIERYCGLDMLLQARGYFNLPTVDSKVFDLACWHVGNGRDSMPIDGAHDFFRD